MDLQERSIMSRRSHLTNLGELHGANREEQVKDVLKCSNRDPEALQMLTIACSLIIFFLLQVHFLSRYAQVDIRVPPGLIFFLWKCDRE